MNVLIPMAGMGQRFVDAGYQEPKPLIPVLGTPMIELVVKNLGLDAHYIFIVQKSHSEKYNLHQLLKNITPSCSIIEIEGITEGAACSTLLAKEFINKDEELVIANSDQYVVCDTKEFINHVSNYDAGMLTFTGTNPKWSFAELDSDGYVKRVAEKDPISDVATVGIYYWRSGAEYVKYAEQMISKNIRVRNEFYVCPVFNEAIEDNKKVVTHNVEEMWGLGTPEDLEQFINARTGD